MNFFRKKDSVPAIRPFTPPMPQHIAPVVAAFDLGVINMGRVLSDAMDLQDGESASISFAVTKTTRGRGTEGFFITANFEPRDTRLTYQHKRF